MTFNPDDPQWVNRDRFVLSAGHGSMFLYSWLHLAGYDIPKDEVANFRQHHSATPGHPEFPNSEHTTPGIEATTGPLGAGISNCAGLAAASKMSAAMFNTPEHTIFDNHIFCMVGDGCLQEGVSAEASCFAAHEKLDNLIVLYDANDVTLDKMAEFTQSEDVGARYEAYGWDVITLTDGHDLKAISEATRISGSAIINDIAAAMPLYISGSADLHGSNKNYIKGAGDFGADFGKSYKGRNVYYGIR